MFLKNRLLRFILFIYLCVILIAAGLVCRSNYLKERDALLATTNNTLIKLMNEYKGLTDDFWHLYMPMYTVNRDDTLVLSQYFDESTDRELSPIEQRRLSTALEHLRIYLDSDGWIALYSPNREYNYIYTFDDSVSPHLKIAASDMKLFKDIDNLPSQHMYVMSGTIPDRQQEYIVIVGGAPFTIGHPKGPGRMLWGFNTRKLVDILGQDEGTLPSLRYYIVEDGKLVFSTCNTQDEIIITDSQNITVYNSKSFGKVHIHPLADSLRNVNCYFTVSQRELIYYALSSIQGTVLLMVFFIALSVFLFILILQLINREISFIRQELSLIGQNHLDHRIPENFKNDGFNDIAYAINQMTEMLERTVERSLQFELKHKESMLAELMAKFNPHFLYNTLELLRGRCTCNGDEETAELIVHISAIFRRLLNPQAISTLREELAFGEHYLLLFRMRYGEHVQIRYNISSDILDCVIIRNIFQPLIENYFEHGFVSNSKNNYLVFSGHAIDQSTIQLAVEDNGNGMNEKALRQLQQELESSMQSEQDSYGLRNLHQRIRLYYGRGYGLTLSSNPHGGFTITIKIARIIDTIQTPFYDHS